MKRFLRCLTIFVLVFLMLSASAAASSIFDLLPDNPASADSHVAPSYGNICGEDPVSSVPNAQNDTLVEYDNVSVEDVDRFGTYLGRRDYTVIDQQVQGNQYGYRISNGTITFSMIYNAADQIMYVIYPQGIEYEPVAFPGYKRLELGDTVRIDNLGEFTFKSFSMSEKITNVYGRSYHYGDYYDDKYAFRGAILSLSYYNSTSNDRYFHSAEKAFSVNKNNSLFDEEFQYLSGEMKFPVGSDNMGIDWGNHTIYSYLAKCAAAKTTNLCVAFKLEDRISASTDGTVGITFAFHSGGPRNYPKYVLVLRENGKNLY